MSVTPNPAAFHCCDAAQRSFRRCSACDEVWVQCAACKALFGDLDAAKDHPPARQTDSLARSPACPACHHSIPPRFGAEHAISDYTQLPWWLRDLLAEPPQELDFGGPTDIERKRTDIMYVDLKDGTQPRIMRVELSRSGRTVYLDGRAFRRTGSGYKHNFFACDTGYAAWLSRPRRDGFDGLYPEVVHVEQDVREHYWRDIRRQPDKIGRASYKSPGKYTKRGRGKKQSGPEKR